jgi:two-component system, OmpR family, alkaline phosphatase synthesis response regulator PhoP
MSKRILVVDDSHSIVKMVEVVLKKEGYEVFTAFDGEAGLRMAQTTHPDLIVLDIIMPKMDGVKMCRMMQNDPATADIPVIFLTVKGQMGEQPERALGQSYYTGKFFEQLEGYNAGAVDYITKPVIAKELLRRVKAMLWIGTSDAKE